MFYLMYFLICFIKAQDYYDSYQVDENPVSPTDVNKILTDIISGDAPLSASDVSYITEKIAYNSKIRPSGVIGKSSNVDTDGSLKLTVMLSLRQIVSLDEKNQILTSSIYLLLYWGDPRLMWNPNSYNGVKSITVPSSQFWLPDLAIMNAGSGVNLISYSSNQNLIISYDGSVFLTLSLPSQSTRCKINAYQYPLDTQTCSIVIGSWLNNDKEFNFQFSNGKKYDISDYIPHPIWNLKTVQQTSLNDTSRFKLANFELKNRNISTFKAEDIIFKLILKRNPLYIMINGIFPCLVLNLVILIAFAVPYAQQVALCMTSFLTFTVSSLRISGEIPVQSDYLPLITLYLLLSIIYTFVGFSWFIFLDNLSKKKKLNIVLTKLALITRKILFWILESPKIKFKKTEPQINEKNKSHRTQLKPIDVTVPSSSKCAFCNRCSDCLNQLKKEKSDKSLQNELKENISALNNLAFFLLFFTIFTCNLAVWLSMNNKNY